VNKSQLEAQLQNNHPGWWDKLPQLNAKNAYKCSDCHKVIVTIDVDRGTTPAMLACRRTEGCEGLMMSAGYPSTPFPAHLESLPHYEWYRPESDVLGRFDKSSEAHQHVIMGGLILRKKDEA
jgi:hypothetical protein